MKCESCGSENSSESEHCTECGSRLAPSDRIEATALYHRDSNRATPTRGSDDSLIGHVVDGCHILEKVGAGGAGTVYRARQLAVGNRIVALKVFHRSHSQDPTQVLRFQQEPGFVAKLSSRYIVEVFTCGYDKELDLYYIVMKFVEGGLTLAKHVGGAPIDIHEGTRLLQQCCEALADAEANHNVHRDIKPANILLARDRETDELEVRIGDFGAAKSRRDDFTTSSIAPLTPRYASPEQWTYQPLDSRSDMWCLGATFFHALTGQRPPGNGDAELRNRTLSEPCLDPANYVEHLPDRLEQIIRRMTARHPKDRFDSFNDLLKAVKAVEREEQPAAAEAPKPEAPPPIRAQPRTTVRNRRLLWSAAAATAVLAATVTTATWWGARPAHAESERRALIELAQQSEPNGLLLKRYERLRSATSDLDPSLDSTAPALEVRRLARQLLDNITTLRNCSSSGVFDRSADQVDWAAILEGLTGLRDDVERRATESAEAAALQDLQRARLKPR